MSVSIRLIAMGAYGGCAPPPPLSNSFCLATSLSVFSLNASVLLVLEWYSQLITHLIIVDIKLVNFSNLST